MTAQTLADLARVPGVAPRDAATRDFVRSELRSLLEEMEERGLEVRRREGVEDGTSDTPESRDPR